MLSSPGRPLVQSGPDVLEVWESVPRHHRRPVVCHAEERLASAE